MTVRGGIFAPSREVVGQYSTSQSDKAKSVTLNITGASLTHDWYFPDSYYYTDSDNDWHYFDGDA